MTLTSVSVTQHFHKYNSIFAIHAQDKCYYNSEGFDLFCRQLVLTYGFIGFCSFFVKSFAILNSLCGLCYDLLCWCNDLISPSGTIQVLFGLIDANSTDATAALNSRNIVSYSRCRKSGANVLFVCKPAAWQESDAGPGDLKVVCLRVCVLNFAL